MARDKCIREFCRDEQTITYKLAEGKKLLVWPDSVCLDTMREEDKVRFLAKLRDVYGFSLISVWGDEIGNKRAQQAGWTGDQIVFNASDSSLDSLNFIQEFWANDYANRYFVDHGLKVPPEPRYFEFWEEMKKVAPPIYSVFYDEPWYTHYSGQKKDYPIYIDNDDDNSIQKLKSFINEISKDISSFLADFCTNCRKYDLIFKFKNNEYQNLRLVLLSLYTHACMSTKFVVGEWNSFERNYWRELLVLLDQLPKVPYWTNWVDSIAYQGYASQANADSQIPEWRQLNDLGWSGGRAWVSLASDLGEFNDLFKAANSMGWSELWCFPQASDVGKRTWWTCAEYERRLREFCEAAANYGFLKRIVRIERVCDYFEIPGCRDGSRNVEYPVIPSTDRWYYDDIIGLNYRIDPLLP